MLSPHANADHARKQDLRPMLHEWAKHFTSDAGLSKQIVEATIFNLIEEPDQIDSSDVRKSLFAALSRTAKEAIGLADWRSGPLDIEVDPERDGYVVVLTNGTRSDRLRFVSERFAVAYAKTLNSRTLTIGGRVIPFSASRRRHCRSINDADA